MQRKAGGAELRREGDEAVRVAREVGKLQTRARGCSQHQVAYLLPRVHRDGRRPGQEASWAGLHKKAKDTAYVCTPMSTKSEVPDLHTNKIPAICSTSWNASCILAMDRRSLHTSNASIFMWIFGIAFGQ